MATFGVSQLADGGERKFVQHRRMGPIALDAYYERFSPDVPGDQWALRYRMIFRDKVMAEMGIEAFKLFTRFVTEVREQEYGGSDQEAHPEQQPAQAHIDRPQRPLDEQASAQPAQDVPRARLGEVRLCVRSCGRRIAGIVGTCCRDDLRWAGLSPVCGDPTDPTARSHHAKAE